MGTSNAEYAEQGSTYPQQVDPSPNQPAVPELEDKATDLELLAYERWIDRQWNFKLKIGNYVLLNINPIASLAAFLFIAGFVAWCASDDNASQELSDTKKWITETFTWLYILTQNVWFVFLIVLLFTPYANIKLGRPQDKPDFSYGSWFMMLFAAGLGIGLFFFGVAEPVYHYEPCYGSPLIGSDDSQTTTCYGNRYSRLDANTRAQWAMNLTFYHWGFYGWVVYIVVAVLLGYVTYKEGLPLTMKSTFYPLIGDKIFGWMGDVIDVVSVATTMFGVCTSLGLGVKQINAGLQRLNADIPNNIDFQIGIIWVITAIATLSVVSGVKVGIRRLSEITFALGTFIMIAVFFFDDSFYILNLLTQSLGFYIQYFPQLSMHTDTFEQLFGKDGEVSWMDDWTIFYWGWWVAWCPFVGMFIAKVSKGRTVRDIIIGGLIAPAMYSFVWFSVFGGAGLRMEREAEALGLDSAENMKLQEGDITITRLAFGSTEGMLFDLLDSYPLSNFFSVISIIALILYFVTSSDSGSLVIDILTANGHPEPPVLQRIFWALLEGACATALLSAGDEEKDSLSALRTVSVIAGLPYTVILCLMCQALWIAMRKDAGHVSEDLKPFQLNLFDPITEYTFTFVGFRRVILNIFCPFLDAASITSKLFGGPELLHLLFQAATFYAWPVLLGLNRVEEGLWVLAWVFYVIYVVVLTMLRGSIRSEYGIEGDVVSDFLVMLTMYPLGVYQMSVEIGLVHHQTKKTQQVQLAQQPNYRDS
eukprot:TRINITY_DN373_c0_g1_i1.p1 TRINITY_DN373_c0_g1~~TRINITY_DN373_c0_g1_i1.p1  ORF type:complete len:759 (-),score=72.00 TRINITY_DN373_c0_g1_i1:1279-3555(-)